MSSTSTVNASRLFNASCMALVVTSMTFAIRAGILGDLGKSFNLSDKELGQITSMAFLGFPVATTLGGFLVDAIGMKRFMWLAFFAHLLGLVMTIFATGFWSLFISTFLVGFANGTVEAVCNPLVTSLYPDKKVAMLNKFHVWFPGGIVIGALLSILLSKMGITGQMQCAIILIPTLLYAYMFLGQEFPKTERVESGVSTGEMYSAIATPMFLFLGACMFLTANTELSTGQWIDKLLGQAGANALLILALTNGLMAALRFFGGDFLHKSNPVAVLLGSAVLATLGLYLLRTMEGSGLYLAAIVFALGAAFFWPTMLGYTSQALPKSGALGLSLMGGIGMLGSSAYQSYFLGPQLGAEKARLAQTITDPKLVDLAAGRSVLGSINILPVILIVAFGALYLFQKRKA